MEKLPASILLSTEDLLLKNSHVLDVAIQQMPVVFISDPLRHMYTSLDLWHFNKTN